ncbi:phosphate/phosphite/phosphonate ABC transporter substrate-binding protein [Guggenheimella bovis]
MKKITALLLAIIMVVGLVGCNGQQGSSTEPAKADKDSITIVWYPNESGADLEKTRNHIADLIAKETGKKVEHQLTTDYAIAIEAIANGKADVAFMGAQGYVEAHTKNEKVLPIVVNSGKDGTLDSAVYYSWFNVKKGNEGQYMKDGKYSIDNIVGKRMSFVSNSSTSGFKVPTAGIIEYFKKDAKWANLTAEDLSEGGADKMFSEVLFGGSHQGSAVNLLTDKVDVAAFCDVCVGNYVEPVGADVNKPGAVYRVIKGAAEPFNTVEGAEFVVISTTPVLNAPFAANLESLGQENFDKIQKLFTSDAVTNDPLIFIPKDSKEKGLWKDEGESKFLPVTDDWFNPIRELSK